MKSIGFIGGDLRAHILPELFKNEGYEVCVYGYSGAEDEADSLRNIYNSDIIVFPMPTCNADKIFAPFFSSDIYIDSLKLPRNKIIFYAGANDVFKRKLDESGSLCIDYMKREELQIKNAVPTAEGAAELAISETAHTVFGEDVLITGYGNVARALARVLKALGANVTVAARKPSALADAWSCGYSCERIESIKDRIGRYKLIFNTVPAMIFCNDVLNCMSDNALLIDLASKPGGVDFSMAKAHKKRVIWALSLPGKTAPITAGKIIFDTILTILSEIGGEKDET